MQALPKYPDSKKFSRFPYKLMEPSEAEAYEKALISYYCHHYASQLNADEQEIIATQLAEYAADCLHEYEGFSESVYNWLDDDTHWIWCIALGVVEKFNED